MSDSEKHKNNDDEWNGFKGSDCNDNEDKTGNKYNTKYQLGNDNDVMMSTKDEEREMHKYKLSEEEYKSNYSQGQLQNRNEMMGMFNELKYNNNDFNYDSNPAGFMSGNENFSMGSIINDGNDHYPANIGGNISELPDQQNKQDGTTSNKSTKTLEQLSPINQQPQQQSHRIRRQPTQYDNQLAMNNYSPISPATDYNDQTQMYGRVMSMPSLNIPNQPSQQYHLSPNMDNLIHSNLLGQQISSDGYSQLNNGMSPMSPLSELGGTPKSMTNPHINGMDHLTQINTPGSVNISPIDNLQLSNSAAESQRKMLQSVKTVRQQNNCETFPNMDINLYTNTAMNSGQSNINIGSESGYNNDISNGNCNRSQTELNLNENCNRNVFVRQCASELYKIRSKYNTAIARLSREKNEDAEVISQTVKLYSYILCNWKQQTLFVYRRMRTSLSALQYKLETEMMQSRSMFVNMTKKVQNFIPTDIQKTNDTAEKHSERIRQMEKDYNELQTKYQRLKSNHKALTLKLQKQNDNSEEMAEEDDDKVKEDDYLDFDVFKWSDEMVLIADKIKSIKSASADERKNKTMRLKKELFNKCKEITKTRRRKSEDDCWKNGDGRKREEAEKSNEAK